MSLPKQKEKNNTDILLSWFAPGATQMQTGAVPVNSDRYKHFNFPKPF